MADQGPSKCHLHNMPPSRGTSGKDFLSAAEKFDKERGLLDDTNAFFSCDGYGVRKSPVTVSRPQFTNLCTRPEMGQVSEHINLSSACFILHQVH